MDGDGGRSGMRGGVAVDRVRVSEAEIVFARRSRGSWSRVGCLARRSAVAAKADGKARAEGEGGAKVFGGGRRERDGGRDGGGTGRREGVWWRERRKGWRSRWREGCETGEEVATACTVARTQLQCLTKSI